MVKRDLVVTAGSDGYTRPYRDALGPSYRYTCINNASLVSGINWNRVHSVVFSGGADISPLFYNREAHGRTYCSNVHDELDHAVLRAVDDQPIYKLGTCRGAQLLWADSEGAQIVQHIDHHTRDHLAEIVSPGMTRDFESDEDNPEVTTTEFGVPSLHHQACIWDSWEANESGSRPPVLLLTGISNGQTAVEAWCNPHRGNLGFQYHPEWMAANTPGYQWTQRVIRKFIEEPMENDGYDIPSIGCSQRHRVDLPENRRT